MSNIVIKAEDISKQYRLGLVGTGTVKDDFKRWWHKLQGKDDPFLKIGETNDRSTKGESNYVWSLKDINFEISQGDSVGIIGKNGAGKSTLLKILSQVTQPTTVRIYTKGRIASLLEVGTGFHPEMTGRENIYLNGAILGMRKKEITRKLDEIIDFSGVERYIDTPVKRYSSGMYVRLAFAVAAYLESEILIVDEVLAVGDAEFQKKCLGKMGDISAKDGRTVLFVSHNLAAVKNLCNRGILLENGIVSMNDEIDRVVDDYSKNSELNAIYKNEIEFINNGNIFNLLSVEVMNENNEIRSTYSYNEKIKIKFTYEVHKNSKFFSHAFNLYNSQNLHILTSHDLESVTLKTNVKNGIFSKTISIPKNFLNEGNYFIDFALMSYNPLNVELIAKEIVGFEIIDDLINRPNKEYYTGKFPGILRHILDWENFEKVN